MHSAIFKSNKSSIILKSKLVILFLSLLVREKFGAWFDT